MARRVFLLNFQAAELGHGKSMEINFAFGSNFLRLLRPQNVRMITRSNDKRLCGSTDASLNPRWQGEQMAQPPVPVPWPSTGQYKQYQAKLFSFWHQRLVLNWATKSCKIIEVYRSYIILHKYPRKYIGVNPFPHIPHSKWSWLAQDDGGPGRAAALYSHFWMLRRVQRGYACFDAYARSLGGNAVPFQNGENDSEIII